MTDNRKKVKLSRSQIQLLTRAEQDLLGPIQGVQVLANELMFYKIKDIAKECNIDLDEGDWNFSKETWAFEPKIELPKPTPTIPGKRRVNKKSGKKEEA